MKTHFIIRMFVLSTALVAAAHLARGAQYYWTNGVNTNINWSYGQNWSPNGPPSFADDVIFTSSDAFPTPGLTTVGGGPNAINFANFNNVVDAGFGGSIGSLTYSNAGSAFNNTYLTNGVTLNVTNLGGFVSGSTLYDFGSSTVTNTIAGTNATLNVSNASGLFFVGFGSASGSPVSTLDLSALQTFNATVSRFMVAVAFTNTTTISHPGGILYLAATNSITAGYQTSAIDTSGTATGVGALIVGDSTAQNGAAGILYLGQSNYIAADTICVARQKNPGRIQFNPAFPNPIANIGGFTGSRVATWIIGDGVQNAGTAGPNGNIDFSLGTANAQVSTLYVGRAGASTSGGGAATGTLSLGSGTVNVNNAYLGYQPTANTSKTGTGTLNINSSSGTLVVNGNLYMANCATAGKATGTLNVTNGSVLVNNIVAGAGNCTISLFGGKLIITNAAGTTTAGLNNLNLSNAVLQVSAANGVAPIVATNVTADYSATDTTTINVTALPTITSYPTLITLIQSPNPISLQNGSFSVALGSLPAGYQGQIIQGGANGNLVQLKVNSGPQAVSVWTGADILPNHNTNWTDITNWASDTAPGNSALVIFNSSAAQASSALSPFGGGPGAIQPSKLNNIVNGNFTVITMVYTNMGGSYENTSIAANDVLTLDSGFLTVGSPTVDFGNTTGNATISGAAGTLNVPNTAGSFYVGLGSATPGFTPQSRLDMSGLGTFLSSNANLLIGVGGYSVGSYTVPQPSGVVYLAETNVIYAVSSQPDALDSSPVALEVGDADTLAGQPSTLYLGSSNAIYADNIATARQLASGGIFFNPAFTNANPTVSIQGFSAGRVANWIVGDGAANATSELASSGTNDFTGGTVNALANTLCVGNNSSGQYAGGLVSGTLSFNAGTINVNNLNVSYNGAASDGNVYDASAGTVNVGGAGLLVVNANLNLAYVGGNQAYGTTPSGTLNITNGGSVWANAIVPGANGGASVISISGGTLLVSNTAGTPSTPLTSLDVTNAAIDLAVPYAYAAVEINASALEAGGATNTINIFSLPPLASYPVTFTLIQSAGAMSQFNFGLGSLPAGYTGSVSESGDQTAVLLTISSGPVALRPYVLWDGKDSAADMNWSDRLNWQNPGTPVLNDNVLFNDTDSAFASPFNAVGAGSGGVANSIYVNNVVDTNLAVSSLTFTNVENDYQNTLINNNIMLTTSNLTVGSESNDYGASAMEFVTVAGLNGSLNVNNPAANVFVGLTTATENAVGSGLSLATLDLSGLGTFTANVSTLAVGGLSNTSSYISGVLYLAQTNAITASGGAAVETNQFGETLSLMVGEVGKGKTTESYLYLGQVNTFNVNTIGIGLAKENAAMQFNSGLAGTPVAVFRAADGVSPVSTWAVGDGIGQTGASSSPWGASDFSLGSVNALVSTMYLGRTPNASGANPSTGVLTLAAGAFNVAALYDGYQAYSDTDYGVGVVNLNGPGALVVSGSLYLAATTGGTGAPATTGTLNINGGAALVNNIVADAAGNSAINLDGGALLLTNAAGTAAAPLTSLSLSPGAAGNTSALLQIQAASGGPAMTVNNLIIDGMTSTTNVINLSALPPIAAYPAEIPLIKYASFNQGAGTFNIGLGALPASRIPYVGVIINDTVSNTIAVRLSAGPAPQPAAPTRFTAFSLSGTTLSLSGTNGVPYGPYVVLTSTNLAQGWTPVATNSFDANGNFSYGAAYDSSDRQRFYTIEQP